MRELTVILSDVYGLSEVPVAAAPALAQIRRFGNLQTLPGGWRPWIAERLGRPDLASLAPASLAAALQPDAAGGWRLLATPVHLEARLDHVHMDSGAMLDLEPSEAAQLAADFAHTFAGTGLELRPLPRDGFLLLGFPEEPADTHDPARALGGDVAGFLPQGPRARRLRALGGELEMWLHAHPLNRARQTRGQSALTTLWLWGGGEAAAPRRACDLPRGFGDDACLQGLWQLCEASLEPAAAATDAAALGTLEVSAVVEFAVFREGARFAGLADFDHCWLAAALAALRGARVQRLSVVAGDRLYRLERRDLWKFWRRAPLTLAVAA